MKIANKLDKIALGGGCHWCTEAVFQSLAGVEKVEQGFVASSGKESSFSEAVIVHFSPNLISLKVLIKIHLHTHKSTSAHSMRAKYRSAIYTFSEMQSDEAKRILQDLQIGFSDELITKILPFQSFKPSGPQFVDYYKTNPNRPFCKNYIHPKLNMLSKKFSEKVDHKKMKSSKTLV